MTPQDIYMYSNFINKSPLYINYIHSMVVISSSSRFKIQFPMVHSYIYIFQSHDCHIFSLVTIVGNMYNICMHSSCHSFINMHVSHHTYTIIDTNKSIYETSPFYKKFYDKVTVTIYYTLCDGN